MINNDNKKVENNSKYEELLKKDIDMQTFMDSFDTKKDEIVGKTTQLQSQIMDSLEKLSVGLIIYIYIYCNIYILLFSYIINRLER